MAKTPDQISFHKAKEALLDSLGEVHSSLVRSIDEGMIDSKADLYNECVDLISEAHIVKNWDEIEEVVAQAKILEQDVAAWLSFHGRTSLSLNWPRRPH